MLHTSKADTESFRAPLETYSVKHTSYSYPLYAPSSFSTEQIFSSPVRQTTFVSSSTMEHTKKSAAPPTISIPTKDETKSPVKTVTFTDNVKVEKSNEEEHDVDANDDGCVDSNELLEIIAQEHLYINRHRNIGNKPECPKANHRLEIGDIWAKVKGFAFRSDHIDTNKLLLTPVSTPAYSTRQTSEAISVTTSSPVKEVAKSSHVVEKSSISVPTTTFKTYEVERASVQTPVVTNKTYEIERYSVQTPVTTTYKTFEVEKSSIQTSSSTYKKVPEWGKQALLKEAEEDARPVDQMDYCGLFLQKSEEPQVA